MADGVEQVAARISAHEAVCAERWGQIRQQLEKIDRALSGLWKVFLAAGGALICGMAGLIVTLALHGH